MQQRELRNFVLAGVLALGIGLALAGILLHRPLARLSPAGATVRLAPGNQVIGAGQTFTASLQIDQPSNLAAYQVDLVYDPAVVEVITVTLRPLLESTGRTAAPLGPKARAAGRTTFAAYSYGHLPGVNEAGTLAEIRLRALHPGSTVLRLENLQIADPQATSLPGQTLDARVTVAGAYSIFLPALMRSP